MIASMGSQFWKDHKGAIINTAMSAVPSLIGLLAEEQKLYASKADYY